MPRYAYRLAYDGRPYRGFQRQPDVRTVEGTLFAALRALGVHGGEDPPTEYSAAGRTDAGVSAVAQTVTVDAPEWCRPAALNGELPGTVRAWARADVGEKFHATHDATARTYVYHLHAPVERTDEKAVGRAVQRLSGQHDFHNLTPDDRGTRRDLWLSYARDGDFLVVRATAGGFPREFVRRLVSLLDAVGRGAATLDRVDRLLGDAPVDGPDGVGPAAPEPLVLADVTYPDQTFDADAEAVRSARAVMEERRVAAASVGRALGTVRHGIGGGDGSNNSARPETDGE